MTESSTVVCSTSEHDICPGTSGSLIPGTRAKVIDPEGREITEYGKPGELLVQSPSVTLGYLNNERATAEAYIWDEDGRWLRTGDEVIVTKSPNGYEHITVVDRLKELIKVKVRITSLTVLREPSRANGGSYRPTKSHPPSSKPISSPTPPSTTVP
jgi:long-subunit acyl-CoA synthetase (AMP-forming)